MSKREIIRRFRKKVRKKETLITRARDEYFDAYTAMMSTGNTQGSASARIMRFVDAQKILRRLEDLEPVPEHPIVVARESQARRYKEREEYYRTRRLQELQDMKARVERIRLAKQRRKEESSRVEVKTKQRSPVRRTSSRSGASRRTAGTKQRTRVGRNKRLHNRRQR